MNKKTVFIIISIVTIAIVIVAYFFFKKPNSSQTALPAPVKPGEFVIPPVNLEKMAVPVSKSQIETNNIYKNPIDKLSDGGVGFVKAPDYYISFYPKDSIFTISIEGSAIESARSSAEAVFLQSLGITKDQACQLNVSLFVAYFANAKNSGQDFGLSFCPNGKPFIK